MTHPWHMGEVRILRRHRGPDAPEPLPRQAVARLLGRTLAGVDKQCQRLGLADPYRPWTKAADARLRQLAAAGASNAEAAAALGRSRHEVARRRRALGLPPSACRGRTPEQASRHAARVARSHGQANLTGVRQVRRRVAALCRGWPGCTLPEADVLDALCDGPRTSGELTAALGYAPGRHNGTVWVILDRLRRRGLVACHRPPRTAGRGSVPLVWGLAPGVVRGLPGAGAESRARRRVWCG